MVLFPFTAPIFQPAMRVISAITQSNPAIVTTTIDHLYKTGTIVRLDLPKTADMPQINQQFGPITVLSPTTFAIDIDSTNYDAFVYFTGPFPPAYQEAQCTPIGQVNLLLTEAVRNVLPYP
jgi:hypothetical protein